MSLWVAVKVIVIESLGDPKIAIEEQGRSATPRASLIVLKTNSQKLFREEQDQNVCVRLAGEKEHLSQVASNPGYILANHSLFK